MVFVVCSRKMNTRRTPHRRVEENYVHEEIPLQVEDVEQVTQGAQGYQVPIFGKGDEVTPRVE